ncbi:MAG: hypothetical protein A3I61_09910 [Acidobacteria bacterium RIFCSPLOWO2_02_FULL_68_18]|nr:MAG: hypothetical protein A3I61_09910 [Acidobacteria bacterium RIFCSPLOWO2_02_FULL_68_18]
MTARLARTVCSLAAVVMTAACASYYEVPIETPIRPKLDVSAFQRVLVAGFIAGGSDDVDGNLETTRLLRSQLRTKSELRVIDVDVLPLMDVALEGREANGGDRQAPPAAIKEDADLEAYEHVFAKVEYWKRIGEEHQQPLIVTGTVMFAPQARSGIVQRDQEIYDSFGRRRVVPVRTYMERKGFVLKPRFVFIDGRTGAVLHSENFREEILYNVNQTTPALSSYFELMDRLIPSFLSTLSSQRIRGTRILLQ